MKRTLSLKRETLAELNPAELTQVAGGQAATGNGHTCPIVQCYLGSQAWQTCTCCTASGSC
ncbi:MAG: hypothetical protein QOE45_2878 [Frankiaceae bacterium]|nr:hypothetical protein [Frankiaceae bacterium]